MKAANLDPVLLGGQNSTGDVIAVKLNDDGTLFANVSSSTTTSTIYAKASNVSALVVKASSGSLTVAYALSPIAGYLIAIDANTTPASGVAVTPVGLWSVVANQPAGGSYTDAPIPVTSGLVLLVSSSATVYTPVSALFIQGGAR